jgi:hypothetical protein
MNRWRARRLALACIVSAALLLPAAAAEVVFPVGSAIGLVPPPGMTASTRFPGFEDGQNSVFVRLIALPAKAFVEIQKTLTNDALGKQGMTVEKRESPELPGGKGLLLVARQETKAGPIRKWLLIAPVGDITAMASFEMPEQAARRYPETAIRAALASIAVRPKVPDNEMLALLPFTMSELAGLRLVRVVPGMAVQLTDGPEDTLDASGQAHLVISIAAGGPQLGGDRDQFARAAFGGLPPLNDVRIVGSESMRIGGQVGHELRAEAKAPNTGADVQIVQWLKFGTGAYMRIVGLAPKDKWPESFMRFRKVRDGLAPK